MRHKDNRVGFIASQMVTSPALSLGGVEVPRLGFGTLPLVGEGGYGERLALPAAVKLLRKAYDAGVRLIDTALAYGPGIGEAQVRAAFEAYPADLVIATKGGLRTEAAWQFQLNGAPEALNEDCDASLRRLETDCIDLYQLHAVDPQVPLEESLGALRDLQTAGKIAQIGLCNVTVAELEAALVSTNIVSVQNRFNFWERESLDVLRCCEARGIAFLPWYPMGNGQLNTDPQLRAAAALVGATPAQIALAWLLNMSPIVLPIPGTTSIAHLNENADAIRIAPVVAGLDALS